MFIIGNRDRTVFMGEVEPTTSLQHARTFEWAQDATAWIKKNPRALPARATPYVHRVELKFAD